jgi:hypothetical protein
MEGALTSLDLLEERLFRPVADLIRPPARRLGGLRGSGAR